jgi:ubiquinone biosynthesis protein
MKIGVKKGELDYKRFYSDIEQMYNSYIDMSLQDINLPELTDEIFGVCRRNNLSMPKDIILLLKGIMTIEGVISSIAPDLSVMDIAVPFMRRKILGEMNFKQEIFEQVENLYKLSKHGLKLPVKVLELINGISAGKLKINMEHTNLEKSFSELNKMVNRLVFSVIVAALIIGSSLVIRADVGPRIFSISAIGLLGFSGASVMGFWLLVSIIRSGSPPAPPRSRKPPPHRRWRMLQRKAKSS